MQVSDTGSTVALMGIGLVLLVWAKRLHPSPVFGEGKILGRPV